MLFQKIRIVIDNIVHVKQNMLKETLENSLMEKLTISPIVGKELSDTYIKVNSFRKHKTFDEKF